MSGDRLDLPPAPRLAFTTAKESKDRLLLASRMMSKANALNPYGAAAPVVVTNLDTRGVVDLDIQDIMSPLSPQLKATFTDRLPSWSETRDGGTVQLDGGLNARTKTEAAREAAEKKIKTCATDTMPVHPRPPQFSMLHAAAITGDRSGLAKLLSAESCFCQDVDLRDKYGRTPLVFAVLGDHSGCVEVLLRHGARCGIRDKAGRNALHWAAHHGHSKCLKILLNAKSCPQWTDQDLGGVTVLHLATRRPQCGSLPMVLKHFGIRPDKVDRLDKNRRTPLHWAASAGCQDYVGLLVKQGARIAQPDIEGKTPLHWTVSCQDDPVGSAHVDVASCIHQMVEACPSVLNWQDFEGRTALHLAVMNGDGVATQALLDSQLCQVNIADNTALTALHLAAQLGLPSQISMLLESGAHYGARDGNGATPLHYAITAGSVDTVAALMRHPDVKDEPDSRGRTALMWAAASDGKEDIVQALCRHGAHLTHTDCMGNTALHIACLSGQAEAATALVRMGCDVKAINSLKQTALVLCAQQGHADMAKALMNADESLLLIPDCDFWLPIHWAAGRGHLDALRLFMANDQANRAQDKYGRTPLLLAAYAGHSNCAELLLDYGAKVNHQDNQGYSALHWACQAGHSDLVHLLVTKHLAALNTTALLHQQKVWVTPLDMAMAHDHVDIVQMLLDHNGMTMDRIRKVAATRIQALWRSNRIRKSFLDRRDLLIKHEQLRKMKKLKHQQNSRNYRVDNAASSFLGHVIEESHKTAYDDTP